MGKSLSKHHTGNFIQKLQKQNKEILNVLFDQWHKNTSRRSGFKLVVKLEITF
jgi:hypothetical protein